MRFYKIFFDKKNRHDENHAGSSVLLNQDGQNAVFVYLHLHRPPPEPEPQPPAALSLLLQPLLPQPQPQESQQRGSLRGGKNSSMGNSNRSKTSHGSSASSPPAPVQLQSRSGMQISNAGISSWTSRSKRRIEN